jgi:hypothetical protein
MNEEDWDRGELCPADGLPFCERCKPHSYPNIVYITSGGSAFHKVRECRWLIKGQQSVERRGGISGEVKAVNVQYAIGSGYLPCQHCLPRVDRN